MEISKCMGTDCPKRKQCLRYTQVAELYQSYLMKAPYDPVADRCKLFWGKTEERVHNKVAEMLK